MKGDAKVIDVLNKLLAEELTAISQYTVHAEMNENWGYGKLNDGFKKRARVEMKHAEKLIERILFLDGKPIVSELRAFSIGSDVPEMVANDTNLEYGACREYNDAVKLCVSAGDNATKDLLEAILRDEDEHVDELEKLRDQLSQMGVQVFLSTQT